MSLQSCHKNVKIIGIFENNTGKTNEEEFETQVNSILNQATSEAGKIGLKNLSEGNRFVTMVQAGSKGNDLNISFMISCLGQQNVDGKRIPYGFEHRTLPHFTKYDDSPGARGFVESSYINGLSPDWSKLRGETEQKIASTNGSISGLESGFLNYSTTNNMEFLAIMSQLYQSDTHDFQRNFPELFSTLDRMFRVA